MKKIIDLYSDTASLPTLEMKQAMIQAPLGDEQRGLDPTTAKLEEIMAHKLNKTAAMFFPSATMCNQIAVKLHTEPGDEVIGYDCSHIFHSEGGAMPFHSLVQSKMLTSLTGMFSGDDVKKAFREESPYAPKSKLVLVENTVNVRGGICWQKEMLDDVIKTSKSLNLKTHLDGARLFNASVAQNIDIAKLASGFDTVTICFSKGLAAPTGAILAFDKEHYKKVRKLKQMFGGAMRQSGMLAAACLYSLENMVNHLAVDHENTQILANELSKLPDIVVENINPQTNILFFSLKQETKLQNFINLCQEHKLYLSIFGHNRFRAVLYHNISKADVLEAVNRINDILKNIKL